MKAEGRQQRKRNWAQEDDGHMYQEEGFIIKAGIRVEHTAGIRVEHKAGRRVEHKAGRRVEHISRKEG